MSSVQALRDFINERLTAAAGEIFTVFQQTIVQYEEEIDRQQKLLQMSCKPQITFHGTELQQDYGCREDPLFDQEANYFLEQEEPEPPQIKEEPEEPEPQQIKEELEPPQFKEEPEEPGPPQIEEQQVLGTSQESEQLILKVGSSSFRVPSIEEQSSLGEPEEVPHTEQLLSHDSEVHHVKKHLDSESTRDVELKNFSIVLGDRVNEVPESEKQVEGEKLLCGEACSEKRQKLGTVTDKKKRICNVCGKNFNRPSDLLRHMRTHTGEKPYSCETCGKRFTQQCSLLVHMRIHTGEKPYSCQICGRSFNRQFDVSVHMRTHTGERPYSCETCFKSFTQKSSFLCHKRTHTGEKPFSCKNCGRGFGHHMSLLYHMKTHKEVKS